MVDSKNDAMKKYITNLKLIGIILIFLMFVLVIGNYFAR